MLRQHAHSFQFVLFLIAGKKKQTIIIFIYIPSLKKSLFAVTQPTHSKSHQPKIFYGRFREIIFHSNFRHFFFIFIKVFFTTYLPTWKIMSRVTANKFFRDGLNACVNNKHDSRLDKFKSYDRLQSIKIK